ncbi:MAG: transketolase [Proteobacteria bacterium]|nr:transketolase [Pseudomonadota bacterium]
MRSAFIEELVALAAVHDNIALIVGDLGFGVIEPFADRFPDRFFNAGVAEQNMASMAAGMASEGYHVFTYSIANFPTFRCAEQIRNDIAYHGLPVTTVAVGAGLAYGSLGYSHHAVQDYALMRAMPGMMIAAPGDPLEVRACLRWLVANPGPSYLRLGKSGDPRFHDAVPDIEPGKWLTLRDGDRILLSTGAALGAALARAQSSHQGFGVCSLPLWGMATKASQLDQASTAQTVIAMEDHLADGGFGSWLWEAVSADPAIAARISSIALSDTVCGQVGSQAALNAIGGLTCTQ